MRRFLPALLVLAAVALVALGFALLSGPDEEPPATPGPDASAPSAPDAEPATQPARAVPEAAAMTGATSPAPSEIDSMQRIRALGEAQPEQTLALVAETDRLFPVGRFGDERAFLAMRALVHQGRVAEARDAAAKFHHRYPDSEWAERVVRLTGYQPRRYGPKR